jgi:fibronectin-binding autotransporter adhesin
LADSGAVTVNGGTLAIAGNSDTVGVVTLTSGSITGSGGTLTGSSYALASGNISANLGGSGTVTKTTAGLVTLSGTSSTVGAVNVSGGTLELATGAALNAGLVTVSNAATLDIDGTLTAPTGVNVNAGGTLEGAGTIAGNVNLDGILAPGNSPGTLSINGNLNLTSSSVLNFELNETNTVAGSNINDLVAITGDLVLDGTLNVPDASTPLTWTTSGTDLAPIKWTLFTFTGTLTNNGLTLGSLPTLLSGNSIPQLWQLNIVQNGGGGGSVNLQAVPEPSAALMVGGILAGAACLRRRRVA